MSTSQKLNVILIALATTGIVLVLLVTKFGIGTSPDSIIYLRAARNLVQGQQLEMTHHAPLYAVVLATVGASGIDPFDVARWLNALLFGANILLIGLMVASFAQNLWIPVIASFVVLTSLPMLTIHAMAWTEPMFILLGFLGFFLLAAYQEHSKRLLLVVAAIAVGLAFLTRYAGVALILTAVLGILVLGQRTFSRRLIDALLFGIISAMPMFMWLLRNLLVAGTATNRELFYHPINRSHIWQALYTLSGWLLLPDAAPNMVRLALWLITLVGIGGILLWRRREQRVNSETPQLSMPYIIKLLILFLVVYGLFLAVSISFLDANTPLDDRILSPVYVAGLIVLLYFVGELLRFTGNLPVIRIGFVAILLIFLVSNLLNGMGLVRDGYRHGFGFSSQVWKNSETLDQVRKLPEELTIFSNSPEAIYLYTGKTALPMPKKFFSTNQQTNANYTSDLISMKGRIENEDGVVVYFNTLTERRTLPTVEELKEDMQLCVLAYTTDGAIYGIDECPR